jgi:hypothetical protein
MRNLTLALALSLLGLSTAYAAGAKGIMAPTAGSLKTYLNNAKWTAVKMSHAPNSLYYKFDKALAANPKAFKTIKLEQGLDFGKTAYIPKKFIKGLPSNVAFIESGVVNGPKFLSKVNLPQY